MKIAIGQINPTIGDFEGNFRKIQKTIEVAKKNNVTLSVFPELVVTGYPPRDLLLKESFIQQAEIINKRIIDETRDVGIFFGSITKNNKESGRAICNSGVFCHNGKSQIFNKTLLPFYDVFDEERYFEAYDKTSILTFGGQKIGVSICEDLWFQTSVSHKKIYTKNPIDFFKAQKIDLLITINASPFSTEKFILRKKILSAVTEELNVPVIYANLIGGNDELIFDGRSMVTNHNGKIIVLGKACEEDVVFYDTEKSYTSCMVNENNNELILKNLELGLRDYVGKCGFKKVLLGLSGGIDSALTAYIAKEALGAENVIAVNMPSRYSSKGSIEDSKKLAKNLRITIKNFPIEELFRNYLSLFKSEFSGLTSDVTEENLQARIRSNILMALSNKYGYLLISTGNKSELSVGYSTLYGDMSGGISVLGDVFKTKVYELSHYINRNEEIIPHEIIEKPPSAELRPNQKDEDTLPPYDILDRILKPYIEEGLTVEEIISRENLDAHLVKKIIEKVDRNEYKRRQASLCLRISEKAFGIGRRIPIAYRR